MRLVSDAKIMFTIFGAVFIVINYLDGNSGVTLHNMLVAFVASIANGICMLVSMNAMTKGLAGPTGAILYTQNFYCTAL